MTDRAMLTAVALCADAVVVGQAAHGWLDVPGLILALAATFSTIVAWAYKEKKR